MPDAVITALALTPIKGTRLRAVDSIELDASGARGNRRFYVIDARDRMVNGKQHGSLQSVEAEFDEHERVLRLIFPGGRRVAATVAEGAPIHTSFFSTQRVDRLVEGPFAEALSDHVGQPLRLIVSDVAVDRGERGGVSLISQASLRRLATEAQVDAVDARRFRMLIEVDGVAPHAEDRWVGRQVSVGDAVVQFEGHVGRCLVTSRDPDTGDVDLPTLDVLRAYRGDEPATEPLPFGIYGHVVSPGRAAVGDAVVPS